MDNDWETLEKIHNEAREWKILREWGVTEEAWADIQQLRRLTAFLNDLTGFELETI